MSSHPTLICSAGRWGGGEWRPHSSRLFTSASLPGWCRFNRGLCLGNNYRSCSQKPRSSEVLTGVSFSMLSRPAFFGSLLTPPFLPVTQRPMYLNAELHCHSCLFPKKTLLFLGFLPSFPDNRFRAGLRLAWESGESTPMRLQKPGLRHSKCLIKSC